MASVDCGHRCRGLAACWTVATGIVDPRNRNKLPARLDSHRAVALSGCNACGLVPANLPVRLYRYGRQSRLGGPFRFTVARGARCDRPDLHCMDHLCGDKAHKAIFVAYWVSHDIGATRLMCATKQARSQPTAWQRSSTAVVAKWRATDRHYSFAVAL